MYFVIVVVHKGAATVYTNTRSCTPSIQKMVFSCTVLGIKIGQKRVHSDLILIFKPYNV